MNYIKKLEAQVRALKAERAALNDGLTDLAVYLQSSKFNCSDPLDSYVNVTDVQTRINAAKIAANDVADSYTDIYGF